MDIWFYTDTDFCSGNNEMLNVTYQGNINKGPFRCTNYSVPDTLCQLLRKLFVLKGMSSTQCNEQLEQHSFINVMYKAVDFRMLQVGAVHCYVMLNSWPRTIFCFYKSLQQMS